MSGQFVLEVGSGSGRFTEQVASTKAMVVSVDYSYAVEANYASNGHRDNVLVVQGDIYNLPLREGFFDKLFCFGVLQHTPDVERAFLALPAYLKSGGHIAVDFYRKFPWYMRMFQTKYFVLPLTRRIKPEHLYRMTNRYVECMWPISRVIHKMPYGKKLNWLLLVADYRGVYNLSEDMLKEWAILDVFDMLSPAYDQPQTLDDVQHLLTNAKLKDTDVHYGYNGIEARGVRL